MEYLLNATSDSKPGDELTGSRTGGRLPGSQTGDTIKVILPPFFPE